MIRRVLSASFCLLLLGGCGFLGGDRNAGQGSVAPGINDRYATADGRASAVQIFEGEGREQYQKPDEVIRQMDLAPGDVVCEVGAGSGYSRRICRRRSAAPVRCTPRIRRRSFSSC